MGQSQLLTCQNQDQSFFLQEIRIYLWRADPNFNTCLPRVFFKSALQKLHQERFTQYLKQQESKDYLEISKFKKELQNIDQSGDEQIIIFEKYYCSLARLKQKLALQQSLYALQSLLYGYQEIRKVYQTVIVNSNCCFVTHEGSVRVWINPNIKCNHVWKEHLGVKAFHSIIFRIIQLVEQLTKPSNFSHFFFQNLYSVVNNQLKNGSFSDLRKWTNEYCYTNRAHLVNCINLTEKQRSENTTRDTTIYKRNLRNTEASETPVYYKENNNPFLSTHQSQFNANFNKVKLLEKRGNASQNLFSIENLGIYKTPQTTSQFFPKNFQNSSKSKESVLVQTQLSRSFIENSSVFIVNNSAMVEEKCPKANSVMFTKGQIILSKRENESKKIENKMTGVVDRPSIRKQTKWSTRPNQITQKKSMKASIMNYFPEKNQVRKQNRTKTLAQKQCTRRPSLQSSATFTKPWITAKTLTKLIFENEDSHSYKNSIAQSSDYYNDSVYSGVLTQMGRDVGKPIDMVRGKSSRESEQI